MTGLDSIYFQYAKVLLKELIQRRVLVVVLFSVLLLAVETVGLFHQPAFETSTLIHADQQNIIAPLLRGQAEMTTVENHTRVVREVLYSPRMLQQLIDELNLLPPGTSPAEVEAYQNRLRGIISIQGSGPGFIKIAAKTRDPAEAFNIVSKSAELFIKDVSESKRSESREAFLFIDNQVKNYKQQLVDAEENLKRFKEQNNEGTMASVNARIQDFKDKIAEMELSLEEANIRVKSLRDQIAKESKYVTQKVKSSEYQDKLRQAESRLATLRLSYTDTYPDIVILKEQIAALKRNIKESGGNNLPLHSSSSDSSRENPVYETLRENLSEAEVEVETLTKRMSITNQRLETEYERLKKVAAKDAQLAELVRDYDVTKEIYETMLDRKEKARLSMTLDIEGQGVTYKIQEPATFPLNPTGLRFLHFALLAPLVGIIVPIGLILGFIMLDPRLRVVDMLTHHIDVPVLGVVPHIHTRLSQRIFKKDIVLLGLLLVVSSAIYLAIGVLRLQGVI